MKQINIGQCLCMNIASHIPKAIVTTIILFNKVIIVVYIVFICDIFSLFKKVSKIIEMFILQWFLCESEKRKHGLPE